MTLRTDLPDAPAPEVRRERSLRLQRQFRIRTIMLVIGVAAVWFGYLRIPGAWLLVVGPIVALALGVGVIVAGIALAHSGILFFGWVERGIVRLVRGRASTGAVDDWWT